MSIAKEDGVAGRSYEQRIEALAKANAVRARSAQFKVKLSSASQVDALRIAVQSLGEWNAMEPPLVMTAFQLLTAIRRIGQMKATNFCRRAQVLPNKRIGQMNRDQQSRLADVLRAEANRLDFGTTTTAVDRRFNGG